VYLREGLAAGEECVCVRAFVRAGHYGLEIISPFFLTYGRFTIYTVSLNRVCCTIKGKIHCISNSQQ
jgi:hypothetical protein